MNPAMIIPEIMYMSYHSLPSHSFSQSLQGELHLLESHTGLVHLKFVASFSVLGIEIGFSTYHRVGLDQIQEIYSFKLSLN